MGHGGNYWLSDFKHPHFEAGIKAVEKGNYENYNLKCNLYKLTFFEGYLKAILIHNNYYG